MGLSKRALDYLIYENEMQIILARNHCESIKHNSYLPVGAKIELKRKAEDRLKMHKNIKKYLEEL